MVSKQFDHQTRYCLNQITKRLSQAKPGRGIAADADGCL